MGDLRVKAQRQLKCGFLSLSFGGQLLDPSSTCSELGVGDGDTIDAFVLPVKLPRRPVSVLLLISGFPIGDTM